MLHTDRVLTLELLTPTATVAATQCAAASRDEFDAAERQVLLLPVRPAASNGAAQTECIIRTADCCAAYARLCDHA
jgi:hypothetical protein